MNDRIENCLYQAGLTAQGCWDDLDDYARQGIEKFAELIVRDCLDIAFEVRGKPATDTHYVIGYDRACEKIIDAIKESYGVEE